MSALRDSIRTALTKTPKIRTAPVEHEGVTFVIRQPSVRIQREMNKHSADGFEVLIQSAILCTFTGGPDGALGERVFEETDRDVLLDGMGDADSLLGKISKALVAVSSPQTLEADAKKS